MASTPPPPTITIRPATFPADKPATSTLFLAYEQFLLDSAGVTLDFQNFSHEVASLPGKYCASENGALYLALLHTPATSTAPATETAIGCVGLRALSAQRCELKRLFLTPEARGRGVSKLLMDRVVEKARGLGYGEVVLDTLGSMGTARGLYERYGFVQMEAYYQSHPDAVYYRLGL